MFAKVSYVGAILLSTTIATIPALQYTALAGEKSFRLIAGHDKGIRNSKRKSKRSRRHSNRKRNNYYYGAVVDIRGYEKRPALSAGFLQNKVTYSPRKSAAKIIHVSDQMKRLGEARAAVREANLLRNIDNIKFKYYRPNEAFDVRFPDVVYLDSIRK